MKIAFASRDGELINDHFGWCKCFYLYELKEDAFVFVKTLDSSKEISEEGDKLAYKIESLEDANIVCASHIGPKAVMLVKASGIFVLKTENESERIDRYLEHLLKLKNTQPPLWMQRFLHAKNAY